MITDRIKKLLLLESVALIDAKRKRFEEERQMTSVDFPKKDFIGFLISLQITPTILFQYCHFKHFT